MTNWRVYRDEVAIGWNDTFEDFLLICILLEKD